MDTIVKLLVYKHKFQVVSTTEDTVNKVIRNLSRSGFTVKRIVYYPSQDELRSWAISNNGRCIDGCPTNGLRSCKHGSRSWLAVVKDLT
jgi:hypothetical protein